MSDRSINTAILKMSGQFKTDTVKYIVGTVKSVDKNTCVVTCVSGDSPIDIPNVLLQAEVCDGLLITPKVDSTVFVCVSIYNPPYVAMFSDIDEFYLQVGDSSLTITNDGKIKLNDGSYDGLIQIKELVKKINALENLVNNILTTLKSTTIPLAPSGTYPFAPLYSALNNISPITQQADIENKDITHGKPNT